MEKFQSLYDSGENVKCCSQCGETVWWFLNKLNIKYDLAIIAPNTCTHKFIAALFTPAERWK